MALVFHGPEAARLGEDSCQVASARCHPFQVPRPARQDAALLPVHDTPSGEFEEDYMPHNPKVSESKHQEQQQGAI